MKIETFENQDIARQIPFLEGRIHLFESTWTLKSEIWNLVRTYFLETFPYWYDFDIFQKVPLVHHFIKKIDKKAKRAGMRCDPQVFGRSVKPISTKISD